LGEYGFESNSRLLPVDPTGEAEQQDALLYPEVLDERVDVSDGTKLSTLADGVALADGSASSILADRMFQFS
jgi:hypothetical protein